MKDEGKTKKQLINELVELRRCIAGLKASEAEHKRTEVSLMKEKSFTNSVINSLPGIFYLFDKNGRIHRWNQNVEIVTGYSAEEISKMNPLDFFVGEEERLVNEAIQEVFIKGQSIVEAHVVSKGGRKTPYSFTGLRFISDNQNYIVGMGIDITKCKQAEVESRRYSEHLEEMVEERTAELRIANEQLKQEINVRRRSEKALGKSIELYQKFINSSSDDVVLKDENFKLLVVNKSYKERMIKYGKGILGKTAFDLLPEETAKGCTKSDIKALESDSVIISEEQLGDRIFETRKFRVNLGDDKFGVGGYIRDITERKQIEEALRETNETLQSLIKASPLAIIILDSSGNVKLWNPAAENIFGWSEQEVLGKPHPIIPEDKQDEFHAYLNTTLKGKTFCGDEIIRQKKDGLLIDLSLSTAVLRDAGGKAIGILGIIADITERKREEKELKNSREQLRNLYAHLQSVGEEKRVQLAREIHDELGQVLTALKMEFGSLIDELSTEQKGLVQYTESLYQLIDKALDSVQRICTELRPAMLDDLGLSAAIEWQAKEFEKWSDIKCEIIFEPEEIILDKEYSITLFRIFQEVLTNVARHAQATKVKIGLKEKQDKVILSIKDNGIGITKEKISNHKSLGLTGIRERINHLGGSFMIRGIQGKGTTITVSIPIKTR